MVLVLAVNNGKTAVALIFFSFVCQICIAAFAACAPPRFDTFAEKMVARWGVADTNFQTVEEVMRSCGGAVQGIREVPFLSTEAETVQGPYLNRANDGFIYFDCGSYSSGPVDLSSQDGAILSSLILPKSPESSESRAVLTASIESTTDTGNSLNAMRMSRMFRVPFSGELSFEQENFEMYVTCELPNNIVWTKQQMCFMPSRGQPWMVQKLKWDKSVIDAPTSDSDTDASSNSIVGWAVALAANDIDGSMWLDSSPSPPESGVIFSIGTVCPDTQKVRAQVRAYNEHGMLDSVSLQEGILES